MNQHLLLADVLMELERELRRLRLWQQAPPSLEALASTLPFCVDSLEFHQWLQFVLLPKLQAIISNEAELPSACNISAYAEEVYQAPEITNKQTLLAIIKRLDETITQAL